MVLYAKCYVFSQCRVYLLLVLNRSKKIPHGTIAIGSLFSFLVSAYLLLFTRFKESVVTEFDNLIVKVNSSSIGVGECNLFEGSWIQDEAYPLYNASQCPFMERQFNCLANGRGDKGYLKWRWKPMNCEIPRFNASQVLEKLRGKRVVFVGDSMSRTQWESLICMLMSGVRDKMSVYEVKGSKITKTIRFLGVKFRTFDLRIDFYRSVFLVQPGSVPRSAPKRVKLTLKVDEMDDISNEWTDSDVLVFNSGHWWLPSKLSESGCYFQAGRSLKLGTSITSGFKTAMQTWRSWVENNINPNRTNVFFRTFESSHWSGKNGLVCKVTRHPSTKTGGKDRSVFSDIIMRTVKKMATPVRVLHVTPMDSFRSDAPIGTWSDNPSVPDCRHWCLPGVPDMWNEILLAHLLSR